MNKVKIAAIATLLLVGVIPAASLECKQLEGATPESLVSYLDAIVPNDGNAGCMTFAIKTIGEKRYGPAIRVLTRLLDFRRPQTAEEKAGVRTMHTFYPAVNALEEIGKESQPAVLEAIKADSTSPRARENAVSVWMELYKDESPNGVGLLKREAMECKDAATEARLDWAISKALTWCGPGDMAKCRAAAKTGYPD